MPTYEAQRALPPNEGTIKESWLAHQRREWQRNVSARRRSLSDDPSRPPPDLLDAEATAAAPAAAPRRNKDRFERQRATFHEHNFERHVKDSWLQERRREWEAALSRRLALATPEKPEASLLSEEDEKREWLRRLRAEHVVALARRRKEGEAVEAPAAAPLVPPSLLSTPTEKEVWLRQRREEWEQAQRQRRRSLGGALDDQRPAAGLLLEIHETVDLPPGVAAANEAAAARETVDRRLSEAAAEAAAAAAEAEADAAADAAAALYAAAADAAGAVAQDAGGNDLVDIASFSGPQLDGALLDELEALEALQLHEERIRMAEARARGDFAMKGGGSARGAPASPRPRSAPQHRISSPTLTTLGVDGDEEAAATGLEALRLLSRRASEPPILPVRPPGSPPLGSTSPLSSRGSSWKSSKPRCSSPLVGGSRNGSLHSAASFTGSVRSEGSGGDSPRGSVVRVEDITILRLR